MSCPDEASSTEPEREIAATQRADGTWRKARAIRPGYQVCAGNQTVDHCTYVPPRLRKSDTGVRVPQNASIRRTSRKPGGFVFACFVRRAPSAGPARDPLGLAATLDVISCQQLEASNNVSDQHLHPDMCWWDEWPESRDVEGWLIEVLLVNFGEEECDHLVSTLASKVFADERLQPSLVVLHPSLVKEQRAQLHRAAEKFGLVSQSRGFGKERYLTLVPQEAGRLQSACLTPVQEAAAQRMYRWAQEEYHDDYTLFSLSEIRQIVLAGGPSSTKHKELYLLAARKQQEEEMSRKFHSMCSAGDSEGVAEALAARKDVVWTRFSSTGRASTRDDVPLVNACCKGHVEVVRRLLDAGADPNTFSRVKSHTVLHLARRAGHQEVVELLLWRGAQENSTEKVTSPDPSQCRGSAAT